MAHKHPEHLPPELVLKAAEAILTEYHFGTLCCNCAHAVLVTTVANYIFHGVYAEQREVFINDFMKHVREIVASLEATDEDTTIQ